MKDTPSTDRTNTLGATAGVFTLATTSSCFFNYELSATFYQFASLVATKLRVSVIIFKDDTRKFAHILRTFNFSNRRYMLNKTNKYKL